MKRRSLAAVLVVVAVFAGCTGDAEIETQQLALRSRDGGADASAIAIESDGEDDDARTVLERVRRGGGRGPRSCDADAGDHCARPERANRLAPSELRQLEVTSDGTRHPRFDSAPTVDVGLPERAEAAFVLTDTASGMTVRVRPLGLSSQTATVLDGYVVYRADRRRAPAVVHRPSRAGTEDHILLDAPPAGSELRYELTLAGVAGLRHVGDAVELMNADGMPVLRMNAPVAWFPDGDEAPLHTRVEGCGADENAAPPLGRPVMAPGASVCTVVVSLPTDATRYPLVVDPSWTSSSTSTCPARYRAGVLAVPRSNAQYG